MLNTVETLVLLDELTHPAPQKEDFLSGESEESQAGRLAREEYEAAREAWIEGRKDVVKNLQSADMAEELSITPGEAILEALNVSTQRVEEAEAIRTRLIAVAVQVANLPLRAVAEAAQLHPKTVEKRAHDGNSLSAIVAFKEKELEVLRTKQNKEQTK